MTEENKNHNEQYVDDDQHTLESESVEKQEPSFDSDSPLLNPQHTHANGSANSSFLKLDDKKLNPNTSLKSSGTRRLTKMPLIIGGGILLVILFVLIIVGANRGKETLVDSNGVTEGTNRSSRQSANNVLAEIAHRPQMPDRVVETEIVVEETVTEEDRNKLIQQMADFDEGKVFNEAPPVLSLNTPSSSYEQIEPPVIDPDLQVIKEMEKQNFLSALGSKTNISGFSGNSNDPISQSVLNDSITGEDYFNQRMAQLNSRNGEMDYSAGGGATSSGFGGGLFGNMMNSSSVATSGSAENQWKLNSEVEAIKPYELRTGTIIPSILLSEINSDLRGMIQGQVSENVYDTETGSHLLIPQGTRLIGQYDSDIAYGQNRVMIAWNRLIFPNGTALDIGQMEGADSMGKAGFKDKVNNHYGKMFINTLLMSGVTGIVSYTQDKNSNNNNNNNNTNMSDSMAQALGQQFGQVTLEMIRKNMNISPTIEIRSGFRFNVIVTKDIQFKKPYQY